ncbi:MAG TPA: alpha/beta hydrolase [Pseudoneobacillus sp.]|nr:alpha/beta hydrolase [Pseudoneobacillus sp.]
MKIVIAIIIFVLVGVLYEQLSRRNVRKKTIPGLMIDIGGRHLHVTDSGGDGPTVVIIHGAGDSSYSWIHIRNELSKFTRVITFDRPGMGSSDLGPDPTPDHTVKEIHDLLEKMAITGPCILVGHSLGGLISRLYAMEYPEKVSGLVFLDSTHEFLKDDVKFKQGFAALGVMLKILKMLSPLGVPRFFGNVLGILPMFGSEKSYYRKQISSSEFKQWKEMVYQIFAGRTAGAEFKMAQAHIEVAASRLNTSKENPQFGDLPIAVVNNPGFGENWTEMQKELASRSTNHFHKTSDRKGHSLQMPRPEYVLEAIQYVVNQTT